ncbi:MAG: tetratricopeptide repeat protein [Halobacteriaceae archaeon]
MDDYIELLEQRLDVLTALEGESLALRDVRDRTDASRSTVTRALRSLDDAGLVRRDDGEYALTTLGRLALDHHREYRRRCDDLAGASAVLARLPPDAPLELEAVVGGEAAVVPDEVPYRSDRRLPGAIEDADRYRGVLPALGDATEFRLLYEHVITDGNPAELVVAPELRSSLAEQFPRRLERLSEAERFGLLVGDTPPFGLVLTETDGATTVTVIAYGDGGGITGVLQNDSDPAVRWAEQLYEEVRAGATPTAEPGGTADGGAETAPVAAGRDPALPVALQREGFVRLDRSYFVEQEVADPTTAWRTGPDAAEVHTGYAVERTTGDGTALAERLAGRLAEGEDCVLVGPPGSGKSTTARRVACEWYEAGRGPVLYRESGRGAAFESVEALLDAADGVDGHALVVVEDAVRPEARAVFDAAAGAGGGVSFLLDARESEWREPPADSGSIDRAAFAVESMPRLREGDYERLVERFERTAGVSVDVTADRLAAELPAADADAPGEMLLLAHRLALSADPVVEGPTTLEEDVRRVYERMADAGERALDVATLAATLTAAGIAFGPAHLHAVAGPDEHDAVAAAIDELAGRMLFGRTDDGGFRTVHEAWAAEYLATLLDAAGEGAARRRFQRCVSRLLAVADDPDRRERAADAADARGLERAAADPSGWADGTVERLFAAGRERPKLVPLFGDGDGPGIELPAACSSVTAADCALWFGQMCLGRGLHDWAETAYGSLPADGEFGTERLLGLARVAEKRGDYAAARQHSEACVAAARDAGDRRAEAAGLNRLATALLRQGEFERAGERYDESIGVARETGDREVESWSLNGLGAVRQRQGAYDRARELYEQSLGIRETVGDRRGEALLHNNLGLLLANRGEFDRARSHLHRSLELKRALGDRAGEASTLNNLGVVERDRNRYDRAGEYFEAALEINRETGDRRRMASNLGNLGDVARHRGEYDRAEEYHEEALAIERDLGIRDRQATDHNSLGFTAFERGQYDRAREHHEEALAIAREVGYEHGAANARLGLARVAWQQGDYESAREGAERARTMFADAGGGHRETEALRLLGRIAADSGETETARDRLETAARQFEAVGAVIDALDTLEHLATLEAEAGNPRRVREHCERALSLVDGADPEYDLDSRREAIEERLDRAGAAGTE